MSEITLVNDPKDETISVCNLAAIPLGSYIKEDTENQEKNEFDFEELGKNVSVAIRNLNRIIDVNFYPVEDCANSNYRDRPVGLGVVGLYDAFIKMRYAFDSDDAKKLNREILLQLVIRSSVKHANYVSLYVYRNTINTTSLHLCTFLHTMYHI